MQLQFSESVELLEELLDEPVDTLLEELLDEPVDTLLEELLEELLDELLEEPVAVASDELVDVELHLLLLFIASLLALI